MKGKGGRGSGRGCFDANTIQSNAFGSGKANGKGGGRARSSRGGGRQYESWGSRGGSKGGNQLKGGKGNPQLPKMVKKLNGHTGTVTSIDVSMDKSQFFSGSTDGSVKVWSWEGGNFECVLVIPALVFRPRV